MIKKERKIPLIVKQYEALLRRLPIDHPKREIIEEKLAKYWAGFRGEQSIDYYLSFLDSKKYQILHDVRLPIDEKYVQIDTLILSPNFLILLEVKNITGTLFFDQIFHQLIRTKDGEDEAFPDPILQIKRQQKLLSKWLEKIRIPSIPIEAFIVISNSSTIIKASPNPKEISEKVLHAAYLPERIQKSEKKFQQKVLSDKDLRKISRYVSKQHSLLNYDLLSYFKIKKDEILTGVQCSVCLSLPMQRQYGKWYCHKCDSVSKDAHVQALIDYSLIFKPTFTNRECREFLHLSSRFITNKLLKAMDIKFSGTKRKRTYELPVNCE